MKSHKLRYSILSSKLKRFCWVRRVWTHSVLLLDIYSPMEIVLAILLELLDGTINLQHHAQQKLKGLHFIRFVAASTLKSLIATVGIRKATTLFPGLVQPKDQCAAYAGLPYFPR